MTSRYFVTLVLVAAALVAPGAVAAQEGAENETVASANQTDDDLEGCDVRIDEDIRICESSFENGQSEVVFYSNTTQRITIADMGSFVQGGEVPRKRVRLQEGRNRVTLPGVKTRGRAGISIDTGSTLYSHIIDTRFTLIGGPYSYRDVQVSGLSAALAVSLIVVVQSMRYLAGRTHDPEKIA